MIFLDHNICGGIRNLEIKTWIKTLTVFFSVFMQDYTHKLKVLQNCLNIAEIKKKNWETFTQNAKVKI